MIDPTGRELMSKGDTDLSTSLLHQCTDEVGHVKHTVLGYNSGNSQGP